MENGVGVVDTSHVSEERGLEDGVVHGYKRKEEGVVVGSVEVNDLAGGEVFEEAVETPAHLPRVESMDGNGKVGGVSGVALVDENSTVEYDEAEKFEEPSDAPVEVENFEEAASDGIGKQEVDGVMMDGEEKVGDLVGGDSPDDAVDTNRIDEGGAGNETETVRSSDFREDRLVDDEERKEVPDVDADGGDKIFGSGNHEDGEEVRPVGSNGDMVGDSNLAVDDGNSNVEHDEAEKFEEPSGDPVEVENFEEAASDDIGEQEVEGDMMDGEEKAGDLVGGVSADEAVDTNRIDEGGTGNETATLGSSDFREDRLVGDGEKKEVPDVDADGGDKILGSGNHEDGQGLGPVDANGEMVGDSGLAVADGNSTVEHDGAEKFEEPSDAPVEVENFEEAASDDIGEQEVEGDMMDGEEKVGYLIGGISAAETVDTNRIGEGGTGNETATLGSGDFIEDRLVDEGGRKEVPDVDANGGDKILGSGSHKDGEGVGSVDENREMVGDSGLEVVDRNSNVEHDEAEKFEEPSVDPVEVENFEEAASDENRGEELKDNLATLDTEHQVDESAKLKDVNHVDDKAVVLSDTEADMAKGHQEEMNKKVEASLAGLDTENHVGTCELKDTLSDLSTSGDQMNVASENGTPEMSIVDDDDDKENIQDDASSLKADDSDYTYKTAQKEEKTTAKSVMEKDAETEYDASGLRTEDSDFADDSVQVKEKTREKSQEDTTSLRAEKSDFSDETAIKEEADKTGKKEEKSVVEKDEKMKYDSTGLMADDSDCANDSAQEEEKTPENSVTEKIEEGCSDWANDSAREEVKTAKESITEKIEKGGSDCANDSAREEEKTPEESITQKIEKDDSDCANDSALENEKTPKESIAEKIEGGASSSKSVNSGFADETAKVPNNHVLAKESGKKEQEAKKESIQAKGLPEFQPTSRPASSSAKFTKPASSPAPSARPAGLGRAAPLLEPAPRAVQQPRVNGTASQMQTQHMEDSNGEAEEYDETRETLQMIRVKFLRLAHRLGQTPHNVVVAQVLYRLGLAEQLRGRNGGRVGAFSFDRASAMAEQLEAAGQEPLDFSCTIMVLGKTGVGKSATINSIFDEHKFCTNAFDMGTKKVQDVVGTVQGIKVRVIDTPGLLSSWSDQRQNEKILRSVKQFIKKTPPDIVLYLDRLDMQSRDFSDMPLLRTITQIFGASIWFNAIVVLTHAASAPPDGPNGTASSYDMFVTQRSHIVQQAIRQAAGDMRLMNPVSLVENHSACRTNRAGQRVLPNGQVWKPHLLLLSFASKILAEANTLLKLLDSPPGKPPATKTRAPPLPFLLSSLLQSRQQLKLPGELGDEDDDLVESSDSDSDDESEYDELPPFTRLTKSQVALLSKAQRKAYFDELAYRERLFMKKQLKEERRHRRMMKRMSDLGHKRPSDDKTENVEESSAEISPAPMPDLALPASFDSSNPAHRYRCLDSVNQWVVRPVLDTHGWDHDVGYEGINVERFFVLKDKLPLAFSGQASKDKKDVNIQMEINSSLSHGKGKSTSMGFDLQTLGKDVSYTMRGETKFCNHRRNKATAGLSLTLLGDALSTGVKLEDKLIVNKCVRIVLAGGAMSGRGDVAYGGSLEAQLRDKDYPLGRFLSTLGLSIMDWHGDLAIGGNVQTQVPIGQSTNLIARANLNNRGAGQISVRLNSSEQLQIALFGFIPLLRKVLDQLSHIRHEQQ